MKFEGKNSPPGEFLSKALRRRNDVESLPAESGCFPWRLTEEFFVSKEEAQSYFGPKYDVKWPVELYDGGLLYVPAAEELK